MKNILMSLIVLYSNVPINSQTISIFPNPLNDLATVSYTLPVDDTVTAYVSDVTGQVKDTLCFNLFKTAGAYQTPMDLSGLPNGIYYVSLKLSSQTSVTKIVKTDQPLGIDPNWQLSQINFYPNPAHEYLIVPVQTNPENITFNLTDSQGKIVYSYNGNGEVPSRIDLVLYPKGSYLLNLFQSGIQKTYKVVKD